jgi:hypothetical protein
MRISNGAFVILAVAGLAFAANDSYRESIEKWRQERERRLKADDGWLTVSGLYWLKRGESRFGSDPLNDFVLPESAPPEVGVFTHREGKTTVAINPGVTVTMNGKPIQSAELKTSKDILTLGDLTLFLHRSGERPAIRLKDKHSSIRSEFKGLTWYAVNEAYRVEASFEPYPAPKTLELPNILGDIETYSGPGLVRFRMEGQEIRMEPALVESEGRKQFFFIFRDLTSGKETYPAARFVYADYPADGKVVLDFNKAYNPPCAFSPYTTCPTPPPANRLRVRIEAGEKNYGHGSPTGGSTKTSS